MSFPFPRTALTEEQGIYFVYLQLDEEGYKKQEVTLGADNGKNVQILTGIKPGDRVVTERALSGSSGKRQQRNSRTQPRTLSGKGAAAGLLCGASISFFITQLMNYHA